VKYLSVKPWVCHRNFGPENFGPLDWNFQQNFHDR